MGMLRNYINQHHDDWEKVLELVCFAYRASVHSSTCETPYFLMYGRDPPMLLDRFIDARKPNLITANDYKSQLMKRMYTAFQLVKTNLKTTREKMKLQYDKRAKAQNYITGDKVLLDIKVVRVGLNKKLTSKYEGPYRILEVHNNGTVTITDENYKEKRVHVNRLKPLFETMLWKDEETDPFEKIESRNQHEQHAKTTPVEDNNNNEGEESSSLSTSEDEVPPEIQKAETETLRPRRVTSRPKRFL